MHRRRSSRSRSPLRKPYERRVKGWFMLLKLF